MGWREITKDDGNYYELTKNENMIQKFVGCS